MTETVSYNEKEALRLVAEGDERVFREVFDRYRNKVFYIAQQLLGNGVQAEDVLQEVFIKIWLHRVKLTEIENFKAWLNTITRNEIYTVFRKMANEEQFLREMASLNKDAPSFETQTDPFALRELQAALRLAMVSLTPQQRRVFELSRLEGLQHKEIAARLDLTRETVKKHMTDALRTIRAELGNHPAAVQFGILLFLLSV